ncbi:aldo/keto reductase [Psychrosphaera sp. B3R10]|uniref:aldo/keto reductase n=1 Tax=unclassified Psychrosphaera TaxID=2641570 RepID=UPI001C094A96|nr:MULTISPECIES: aldo/keto reductase [unclassified Psychrosphaera]MBU2882128.1 aldo/keto reductase [Psychrosphaera sp. I2R16]MBU2988809.1 aldo/keto reductase [Psychrosphaera sp. B3R10]MDO6717829.1 aldo/keto reductase [Psychrosphaera sp. 1_MG-2023]
MKYSTLGTSGLEVSRVCLGTMTWGNQNSQKDADEQIEYALSKGVNFFDTAELYPVPPVPEKYGDTERVIGNWLSRNPERRKEMILASKIAGPGLPYIRDGGKITGASVIEAVDDSLRRLKTDYIDLYQLHWPNRTSPHFAQHHVNKVKFSQADSKLHTEQMLEILKALKTCQDAGKIRHCGLSDDTTWGINTYLKLSDKYDLPKMVSIQNEFNLLHTKDWPYLIENCVHENIAYLPWSPLAAGALTGKYIGGARPEGSRWRMAQRNGLFRDTEQTDAAVRQYVEIANKYGFTPAQLALAWTNQIDGVTSTIIGATSLAQLTENIEAFEMTIPDAMAEEIALTLRQYPATF